MALGISWDAPPRVDRLTESEMFSGYRWADAPSWEEVPVRVEPCACGGAIAVALEAPAVIRKAVEAHQATREHRAWRAAMEASR